MMLLHYKLGKLVGCSDERLLISEIKPIIKMKNTRAIIAAENNSEALYSGMKETGLQVAEQSEELTMEQVEAFLSDVKEVCKKHGLALTGNFEGNINIDKIDMDASCPLDTQIYLYDDEQSASISTINPAYDERQKKLD
ncbi:hypothetical protein PVK64_19385 [Aliivibrio sp. S4TY2]|uniref:hypothetical protein n=1 Tax=unclassified Aliivibrio TaxID=2645654 RepID=UPI0023789DAF|nr:MULTISPECIES: hypothetical protein [unclassified Aliivibrio]MDD9158331.1 hypothetical protein [Aliivibrio sp. S4TY2]MDD9162301.1 hypothetical protein [Aliivibrio sp. S4TY1]MDD9166339.1 hypothetical protein [Aliivibrio sp. S4MY2]MDD9170337.1 hypothetical protein [Aliivibrio sp. S4MY4]MDD9187388.1 hypothetical protein [Aliivibrio sp. S4MY3]